MEAAAGVVDPGKRPESRACLGISDNCCTRQKSSRFASVGIPPRFLILNSYFKLLSLSAIFRAFMQTQFEGHLLLQKHSGQD
jgi:hypothetical protein